MKRGLLISLYTIAAIFAVVVLVSGCAGLPSMQYCDKVEYKRDGSRITMQAECRAPVGGGMPGL